MYALNLVKTAARQETAPPSGMVHFLHMFAQSHDQERVAPPTFKLTPRYYIDIPQISILLRASSNHRMCRSLHLTLYTGT